jgi:SAM-dependent methyltransferase
MQLPQFEVHAAVENAHWWFLARREVLIALVHEVLPPRVPRPLVLDIGCGTGGNTAAFAREYDCIGIDPIPEAIAFAEKRFPGVRFGTGYAPQDIPDLMAKADMILLLDVLEHVEHDVAFVQSLLKAMKPGAFLLLFAPADPSLWSEHDKGFEHYRRYDAESFRRLWEGMPVRVRLLSYANARLHPLVKLARWIARVRGKAWGPSQTDLSVPPAPLNAFFRWVFGGEKRRLVRALRGRGRGYGKGVSLVGILEKT